MIKILERAFVSNKVKHVNDFNTDNVAAYGKFCQKHKIKLYTVSFEKQSHVNIKIFKNYDMHSQLELWLFKFKGVSLDIYKSCMD